MKSLCSALLIVACFASAPRAAGLQLSIADGKVSIDAQDVTIRQILSEWSRIGKTRIVNIERLSGGPITIKFDGIPEKQALDIVLRSVPGYIAAPRETFVANASAYDTILIMATTTPVAAVRSPAPTFGGTQGTPGAITQLRPAPPPPQAIVPDVPGSAADQQEDAAMAAAAAAGLIAVPALAPGQPLAPGQSSVSTPLVMPGGVPQAGAVPGTPAVSTPTNPWNAPPGTSQPSLAPPPQPTAPQQFVRPRPPQADR
jgi:hypothetical protein